MIDRHAPAALSRDLRIDTQRPDAAARVVGGRATVRQHAVGSNGRNRTWLTISHRTVPLLLQTQVGNRSMAAALERFAAGRSQGRGGPDPRALALAGELQARLPGAQVLLFGSRAMGDWMPGSDIDLAVIGGDRDTAEETLAQIRGQAAQPYADWPSAQIFHFTRVEFDRCRTSLPHVAGQIQRHGLRPNGEPLPYMKQDDTWEGVKDLLQPGQRHLKYALVLFGSEEAQEDALMGAHNALERCVKAALGADGIDFLDVIKDNAGRHTLTTLAGLLRAELHENLLDAAPAAHLRQLDAYYRTSSYSQDSQVAWPTLSMETLVAAAQGACLAMAGHALALTGRTPREVGYREYVGDDALGGFGTLPLDHYARHRLSDREAQQFKQEGRAAERILALRLLANNLTDSQLARVEADWYRFGPPADAIARIGAVLADPGARPTLLVAPDSQD